ncbi:MAG TPA: hypothetical protein VHG08_13480 [Longimicrobium sp.]|nr:hypothetical protein [Longimicrobium sp.]
MPAQHIESPEEVRISHALAIQTVGIHAALMAASLAVWRSELPGRWALLAVLVVAQGLWLDRIHIAAHEAIHRKLYPAHPRLNDRIGTALLLPVAAPFSAGSGAAFTFLSTWRRQERSTAWNGSRVPAEEVRK